MTAYDLAHRPDGYGTGHGLRGYGTTGPHGSSEAAHYARFARVIGLDDPDSPPASSLQPPACPPLWLCPSCGWSPSDDGPVVDGRPAACPKCGGLAFEAVGPEPLPTHDEVSEAMRAEAAEAMRAESRAQMGARVGGPREPIPPDTRHRIVALARTTFLTDGQIALKLGVSQVTTQRLRTGAGIPNVYVRRGVPQRTGGAGRGLPAEMDEAILDLARRTLMTDPEIGDRVGCSGYAVFVRRVAAGIPCARARGRKNRGRRRRRERRVNRENAEKGKRP